MNLSNIFLKVSIVHALTTSLSPAFGKREWAKEIAIVRLSVSLLPRYLKYGLTYCHQMHMTTSIGEYLKLMKFWKKSDKNVPNDGKVMIKLTGGMTEGDRAENPPVL